MATGSFMPTNIADEDLPCIHNENELVSKPSAEEAADVYRICVDRHILPRLSEFISQEAAAINELGADLEAYCAHSTDSLAQNREKMRKMSEIMSACQESVGVLDRVVHSSLRTDGEGPAGDSRRGSSFRSGGGGVHVSDEYEAAAADPTRTLPFLNNGSSPREERGVGNDEQPTRETGKEDIPPKGSRFIHSSAGLDTEPNQGDNTRHIKLAERPRFTSPNASFGDQTNMNQNSGAVYSRKTNEKVAKETAREKPKHSNQQTDEILGEEMLKGTTNISSGSNGSQER